MQLARFATLLALCLCAFAADDEKPVFPGVEWERVAKPESIGYSSARLEALRGWLKTQTTKSLVVSVGGRILFEYGDVKYVSKVASVRKSILAMMYGKYVEAGKINLRASVKEIGLDDVQKFLPREEHVILDWLLMARSGIYLPEGPPDDDPSDNPPARGSQYPGTFFYYNGWDFNAAGTAFEKLTGKNLYDALQSDLAEPIGMQDYDRKRQKKNSGMPHTVHPEYAMYLSTRDMARIGLVMLRGGEWNGKRVMPDHWSEALTELITPAHEVFPSSLRFLMTSSPARWGYGRMWWVWDQPKQPAGISIGDFTGAYSAWGTGGQLIAVLPTHDMVVAHKVDLDGDAPGDMSPLEQSTILQMVIAAHCPGNCK